MKNLQNLKYLLFCCYLIFIPFSKQIGNIDFKLFEIDSNIEDIVWCGTNQETIFVLTETSSLYKSEDHGLNWKKLNDIFLHTGKQELEENENEVNKKRNTI